MMSVEVEENHGVWMGDHTLTDEEHRLIERDKEKLETCIHCGECESRCPYDLPMQELLPKAMQSLWDRMESRSIPQP